MSVYQKFIESATSPQRKRQPVFEYKQQAAAATTMIKQQANLPTMAPSMQTSTPASYAAATTTSTITPISKQQYKKLVEADHRAIRLREEQMMYHSSNQHRQREQQHHHHYHQYNCSSNCIQQQQRHQHKCRGYPPTAGPIDSFFKTDDPILLKWLQAMRFETELECLTSLQARTLAMDEYSAGALSVRNSQVNIQEMRLESDFILDYIDYLIESLPLKFASVGKFSIEFTELWTRLMNQTSAQTTTTTTSQFVQPQLNTNNIGSKQTNHLTIINCTPKKSQASVRTMRPLDMLAVQIRNLCVDYANLLYDYQEEASDALLDNGQLEATLRKLKELYGKFVEIAIRAECANIVRALRYDFSKSSLNRLSSTSSLHPVRPFESSNSQLPLKWALIALWQLTKDDSYICRTLTEKWETATETDAAPETKAARHSTVAKRLDYSTKYDKPFANNTASNQQHSLRSDYQKLYEICQNDERFQMRQRENEENMATKTGALNSALQRKQLRPTKQMSTIELLIDVIISQPNKHERLDMMNFIHTQTQNDRLIDLDEWDQNISAAIYTSNQYKVAALRILNHLCVNEQAVKTILKCFSTPPPSQGQPIPENKIIRSIFECYQTAQEHIYQNETMFHSHQVHTQRGRKKFCKVKQQFAADAAAEDAAEDYYSDYGSQRHTSSNHTASGCSQLGAGASINDDLASDEGDDVVVKEAIRLLVQLTTPFHRSNQALDFYTLIGRFSIESLVKYLTNIVKSTASREMLFLSLTALANISFITTEPMITCGTNRIMLEMFRASKNRSKDLELRDQAVTILANTADKNHLDIVRNAGLTFLLSCLESCPTRMANYKPLERLRRGPSNCGEADQMQRLNIDNKPRDRKPIDISEDFPDILNCACDQPQQPPQNMMTSRQQLNLTSNSIQLHNQTPGLCLSRLSPNDLAAMERIHQKTAVAFARMSVDQSTTILVLRYGGIQKMIDLCKFSHKRNYSDTVLIACIAALRKMAKVIESETFRHYNALDLIELELNQALEIYGSSRDRHSMDGQHMLFASDV